ncbi:peroxisome proliferator-activated receptor gamma coactivator-related protein 1 [Tiliqua scincoides]|uniref:peroxisome proliferator-activated receptor gamma coactivator-related protein 1 n=1 Tax=Tiliqua scincoides TaxID=71010 RepID=UPI0034628339
MAALWGGGAGHAGAGGTLPLRGAPEPVAGSDLSSTQYLLAEDFRLASVDAKTILEAEELLGTMQDYLDSSSVISIIEDFSSQTETKGRMDAENELSLLTAITEILDSTDDESLSPFDTIPDSELLTSPRERDNSSFQRFLSLSVTPPAQDFNTIEDFQEPRICTIVTEKVEASTTSFPCPLTQNCSSDLATSKKPSTKASRGDWRLFRHKERELPVSQRSDGEEEEEEDTATGHGKSFVAGPVEIPAVSATREVEMDLTTSDGPYVIAPESISLSELVRSMHPYCQPTFTVCLSTESQPHAKELLDRSIVLGVVPDGDKSMDNSVVLKNVEAEFPCRTDRNCTAGHIDREAVLLAPALKDVFLVNDTKIAGLDRELTLDSQAEGTGGATLQVVQNASPEAEKEAQRSVHDQESRSQLDPVAPIKVTFSMLEKGQRCRHTRKKKNKSNKEAMTCRLPSASIQNQSRKNPSGITLASGVDSHFPLKQLEKPGRQDQDEPTSGQASQTKDRMDAEELVRRETEKGLSSPHMSVLKQAEALSPTEEHLSTENQQCLDPVPSSAEQGNGQEPSSGSQPITLENEMVSSEVSEVLPSSAMDPAGQPPRSPSSTKEISHPLKEAKPKPLSLSEYWQRRQQCQPHDGSAKNTTEKQNSSKWPSLPELPTGLADLPCLVVPPPPAKVTVPGLAKDPEKPAGSSTTLAPVGKASATPPSVPAHPSSPATIAPPSFPLGTVNTAPLTTPIPVASPLPNKVDAFPPVGAEVPPTLLPPYLQLNSRAFLPASPSSYILGSPPVPSWSHFAPLPPGYPNLPPPPPATEACPPVFHTIPPMPPPTWPPPPVSLPPFAPGLPFNSVEWAQGPQPSYWSGVPLPPPMLTIPYRDQGIHAQSSPSGTFPASLSEGTLGQHSTASQNTAVALEPSCFQTQCLSSPEIPSLPTAQVPSSVRTGRRRVSDPRRQAQMSAAESITEGSFQTLGKSLSPPPAEILGKVALTQTTKKSSVPQTLSEPHSVPPSQQARASTGTQKSLEEPFLLPALQSVRETPALSQPMESTIPAVAQISKETPPASCPQEEESSPLSAALVPETLTVPTATETDFKEAAPTVPSALASTAPQKVPETGQFSKKLAQTWKHQPLVSIVQRSCRRDIVQAFINEIGIEASDLSSLLEQFEKTAAKKEASSMAKSRDNVTAKNDGSEVHHEKKPLDRLQAPELANVAGLTPPATPPHQLWKPLAAVSLLGKAGSPKGARIVKTVSKSHRKTLAPIHVGSGEHDYCQLSAIPPKEGSRWNVKHNLDITIKPIVTLTKQVPEQPGPSQTLAAVRLDGVGALSMTSVCQNPKELPSSIDADQGQIQTLSSASTSLSSPSSQSLLPESSLSSQREPLDHRTSTPRSTPKRGSDDPCSVLLSPAASPCWDAEESTSQQPQEVMQKRVASKRSLRCYRSRQKSASPQKDRWRGRRNRASRSFSSISDGDSDSSSSSSSSRSRSRTRSPSPPSKRWRRYYSRSSSSSSSDSSWRSRSRSRASSCSSFVSRSSSRSPSLHRRSSYRRYGSSSSRDHYQRQKIRYKESAIEERRVVFIGKIPNRMTRSELRHRFSVFGEIEDCTLHFREQGDNYGFVTYRYAEEAFAAIEGGNAVRRPDEQPFDLCFGGRRQFCKRSYADLDSNREDFEPTPAKSKFDSLDFDTLLKQAQRSLRR